VIWVEEVEGGVWSSILKPQWLHIMLRWRVGVFIERVGVTPPARTLSIWVGIILWAGIEVMYGVVMLNG